ncbi:MAG TPA: site-specific DNA-methyltransferase [Anaerolineaceae bacterium]|nr:site-specific DNA-methyltransferase [Anaerolineaceae bacterium]
MDDHQIKFQSLLRELFQFDCADLDFGIYRIMNYKRGVIERFIQEDLPRSISKELAQGVLAEQTQAAQGLEDAKKKIFEIFDDALDATGNLIKYHNTKPGKEYLAALEKAKSTKGHEALEATIYNHLYAFFSRYWQDGDFISKRRYSKRERYAIPYNGEEVTLYWANHDQYYVKTGEHFADYTWKATNGVTVHFKLTAADVEQNNVKGDKRFFLPQPDEIAWDESAINLTIPFEFRPLNGQEAITYGGKNQQEAIIANAVENISKHRLVKTTPLVLAALAAEKRRAANGESVSFLAHHLRQYTRRNTSDFFIHKDLKGFLSRELDFYLKNEVLNLDEMEAAGERVSEGWFQTMRLIKKVGGHIIEFLAQIEGFQKMLWEKRKFITETFYCITVGCIPEGLYPEIADCEAQWEEWKTLYSIDEEKIGKSKKDQRIEFLKTHPTLVIDTRHFSPDPSTGSGQGFTDRLLASFDDLDEAIDGLLVHSENWQALNLLTEKYREGVKCIHIDPPYNTQTSGFLYKNDYQHSSWLAMMENRFHAGKNLISANGHLLCHIDENEYERLKILLDDIGIPDAGTVVWDKRNPMTARRGVATQHEYIVWRSASENSIYQRNTNIAEMLRTASEIVARYSGATEDAKREYADWVRKHPNFSGGEKAYCYLDENGRIYSSVSLRAPEPRTDPKFFEPLIHPITKKPCPVPPNGFSRTPETLKIMMKRGEILFGHDESTQPRQKRFLEEESKMQVRSVIQDAKKGKAYLDDLGLGFDYCHPASLYEELVAASAYSLDDVVLDFFAGSGTTGHAVINLNREDASTSSAQAGRRKFILVEMAQYFDTVLLPRIKKVTFSPEWKNGKPKRMATSEEAERSPRIVKVIRLESYEDALNNIAFDDLSGQQVMQFEDYLLQYMLQWETRKSETLLNVEKLAKPFSYRLHIHRDGETRAQAVDLPESFAYLLGLNVRKRQALNDNDRRYLVYRGATREGRKVAVIWRETEGWTANDYKRDKEFVTAQKLTEGMDDVYVNGDSYIPGARVLEKLFKERMFAPVEA